MQKYVKKVNADVWLPAACWAMQLPVGLTMHIGSTVINEFNKDDYTYVHYNLSGEPSVCYMHKESFEANYEDVIRGSGTQGLKAIGIDYKKEAWFMTEEQKAQTVQFGGATLSEPRQFKEHDRVMFDKESYYLSTRVPVNAVGTIISINNRSVVLEFAGGEIIDALIEELKYEFATPKSIGKYFYMPSKIAAASDTVTAHKDKLMS